VEQLPKLISCSHTFATRTGDDKKRKGTKGELGKGGEEGKRGRE